MNHNCNGDEFTRHSAKWGRCLMDGAIFPITSELQNCPNCERPWDPVSASVTEADLNTGGWSGEVARQIDHPALVRLLNAVRQDVRVTSPLKIQPSSALQKALDDCGDIR